MLENITSPSDIKHLSKEDKKALSEEIRNALLDITADPALFGHSVGKDERDGKLTAVSVLTLEGAKARVEALLQEAVDALKDFGAQADFFRSLADAVAHRDH